MSSVFDIDSLMTDEQKTLQGSWYLVFYTTTTTTTTTTTIEMSSLPQLPRVTLSSALLVR